MGPLIEELSLTPNPSPWEASLWDEGPGAWIVFMRLSAREGATGRPEEVLDVLGIPFEETRIERTKLIFRNTKAD